MDPDTNEMTHLQQFMLSKEHVQEKEFAQARERRHSMLTVLLDEELLMMHAAAKGETIPQTRERLVSELVGSGAAAEYEAVEEYEENGSRRSSSNGNDAQRSRQQQRQLHVKGPGEKYTPKLPRQVQAQSQFRFGDQVVVNVVERGEGWVVGGRGRESAAPAAAAAWSRSVSGTGSGSGGGSGSLDGVD